MDGTTHLPLYNRISGDGNREIPSSRRAEKLVHLIPVVLLLCLFILWWFSYPVELEIRDGRITAVYQVITQNIPFLHLTNLATVSAPYPIISEMLIMNNGTVAEPASSVLER
ncbi:hypothetical protein BUALT_Bualt02G0053900 [Buddleja alternifolia]|uniref:Uncharacterized protein n=1 Tax=Buddleja alternifolia TaxID=168488 RepID=A0AAV6Y4D2_9LAMI|nr:hypothetical protein BUALT_Bualt02G0053900 [Buddleja alternifolia]